MEAQVRPAATIRFKGFELNPQTRELYRRGLKVRLHGQPIDVLTILVAHPGEMIPRETLRKSLWPEDTFVDFEHSLNSAINRLREALGDSSDAPRFIETIPRLGYRFIVPLDEAPSEPAPSLPMPAKVLVLQPAVPVGDGAPAVARTVALAHKAAVGLWEHWKLATVCAAATFLVLLLGLWLVHRPLPPPHIVGQVQVTYGGAEKEVMGTDGNRLFLNLWDQRTIAQMPISGGPIAQIPINLPGQGTSESEPPGRAPWMLDVSPDGSRLLVFDHGDARMPEVWVAAVSGDSAHYLGKAKDATWSPDGKNIVYATPRREIYLIPADGGDSQLLAELKADETNYTPIQSLDFSPDGKRIRFARGRELWEMDAAGSNLHQILENWRTSAWKCCGRWTADGEFYVFLSGPSALKGPLLLPGGQLWAIDERKGHWRKPSAEPVQLTAESTFWGSPVPAREGHTIFSRGVAPSSELVRYDGPSQQFQPFLGGISAEFVDFSSDGSSIAYVSYPDGILWKARRDGADRVQLTAPPFYPKLIHWSPDGTQILFTDFSPSGLETAYVVSSQGGTPIRVLPEDRGPQQDANWSPDGTKVVFTSRSDLAIGQALEQELRILDLASHKVISIPDSASMMAPRWSPDGRYIAALTMSGADLMLFDLHTQQWTTLSAGQYPRFPVWSRDSRSIEFVLYQNHGVYRVALADRHVERIADLKDFRHAGWYGLWFGLDSNDAPVLLRELGSNEIYQLSIR